MTANVLERLHEAAPKVICLGISALDYIWRVDKPISGANAKIAATDFQTAGGGMAATAAVAAARLGGRAVYWGRAGDDAAGHLMRDALAAEGVDVAGFKLFPEGRSSVSGVIVDAGGERQIVNFRGAGLSSASDWLPLSEVSDASALLADPRWVEGAVQAFAAARKAGVTTVLDADVAEDAVFERLLPLTDHAVFSESGLINFAGAELEAALARAASFGCRVAAVTLGKEGILWREETLVQRQPAFPVTVVDTTGAGDVFHGAYALAIGAGAETAQAMSFASAVAALKCTRPGGRSGIPSLAETLALQRTSS